MRNALIILNPVSGNGESLKLKEKILEYFEEAKISYDLIITNYIAEAEKVARETDENKYSEIIIVGGDGTIVEVINGIIGKNINIGIIPAGTGNDFNRSVNKNMKFDAIMKAIVKGDSISADIGKVNDKFFLNVTGFGIDSYILQNLVKIKKIIKGSFAYTVSTFYTLLKYKNKHVKISIDNETFERDIMLVSICNGKYFGGGMKISPDSEVNDGEFELFIVNKMSKLKFMIVFWKVFKGTHLSVNEVEIFKAKSIQIESDVDIPINVDGNLYGNTPLKASVSSNKINIFC